jgi:hypothetical protein
MTSVIAKKLLRGKPDLSTAVGAKNETRFPGRVPHVRLSVHGPKKTGRSPFQRSATGSKEVRPSARVVSHGAKAFEESVFGPCTLRRTWGTGPGKRVSFFAPTAVERSTISSQASQPPFTTRQPRCFYPIGSA